MTLQQLADLAERRATAAATERERAVYWLVAALATVRIAEKKNVQAGVGRPG